MKTREQERKRLHVSKKSWHGRTYLWWKRNGSIKADSTYQENLCHYLRVVLLWAPIRWFFTAEYPAIDGLPPFGWVGVAFVVFLLISVVVAFPLYSLLVALAVVALVGGLIGGNALWEVYKNRRANRRAGWSQVEDETDSSMPTILYRWAAGKKHRICPLIEVNGDHNN